MKKSEEILNIRDPIHGFISLGEIEKELIQTLPFQRLRFIRQLANTFWIYPSANHSRFEHSLGVYHLSEIILRRLERADCQDLNKEDRAAFKLASLLHDIGHPPFSHAGEKFEGKPLFRKVTKHEEMGAKIIQEQGEIKDIINKHHNKDMIKRITFIMEGSKEPITPKDTLLQDLLTGDVGIDRMDYLLRDSHFLGVMYGKFDLARILETFRYDKEMAAQMFDRQMGSIGSSPIFWEYGGFRALEQFIIARYLMYFEVYFHKTRRILDYHLSHLIKSYLKEKEIGDGYYPDDVNEYIKLTDAQIIKYLPESKYHDIFLKRKFYRYIPIFNNIHLTDAELLICSGLVEKLNNNYNGKFHLDGAIKSFKSTSINVEMDGKIQQISQVSRLVKSLGVVNIKMLYAQPEKKDEITLFSKEYIQNQKAIYQNASDKTE